MTSGGDENNLELAGENGVRKDHDPLGPLRPILVVLLMGFVVWLGFRFVPIGIDYERRSASVECLRITCLVVIAGIGLGLYHFRRIRQDYFGLAEIAFALVSAWFSLATLHAGTQPNYFVLLTSAYLIVRGLTNFDEGKSKRNQKDSTEHSRKKSSTSPAP